MAKDKLVDSIAIIDLFDTRTYDIITLLLAKGYSVSLNKVRVLKFIMDYPDTSFNKVSSELGIDYRNVYRICKEFEKAGVLVIGEEVSQGRSAKAKIKDPTKESKESKELEKRLSSIANSKKKRERFREIQNAKRSAKHSNPSIKEKEK